MIFKTVALCVIFHAFCFVDCAISNAPANHHVNNLINKDENASNTTLQHMEKIATPTKSPEDVKNTKLDHELLKPMKTTTKITIPSVHHKKVLTSIVHPLPRTMHDMMPPKSSHLTPLDQKKAHDDILKHEVPKLQKMLHHHFTVEELRQRRKELKEKWQARHSKPLGLHNKHSIISKNQKIDHIIEKQGVGAMSTKLKTIGKTPDIYEQVTPRTRRILEHKEEESEEKSIDLLHSLKTKHRFSAKTHDRTTLPTLPPIKQNTESFQPEVFQINSGKIHHTPESASASVSHVEYSTKSHFNPDEFDFGFPDISHQLRPDIASDRDWPPYYSSSSTIAYQPRKSEAVNIKHPSELEEDMDSKKRQGDIRPFGYGPHAEEFIPGFNVFNILDSQRTTKSPKSRSVAVRTTTLPPEPVLDDVVSVKIDTSKTAIETLTVRIDTPPFYRKLNPHEKFLAQKPVFSYGKSAEQVGDSIDIHPGLENEQVTIKIDTPPYYRNLTHEEKILIQRPLFGLGKSAEQVGDSIDIHPGLENEQVTIKIDTPPYYRNLTHEEKILIQRPLFGLGKSAEQVGDSIDIHPGLENEQVTIKIDTPPYYRNLTHEEKILIQRPLFGLGKSAEQVGDSIDIHPGLENEQVTIKIDTPPYYRNLTHEEKILIQRPLFGLGKSAEQVGDSIDIHPGLENEQVTIRIDTPPYYRNLTHEEKILIQRPLFGLGKSAEQVGDSIDIHPGLENEQVTIKIDTPPYYRNLTHEEKILIQRPLFGLGKSAEQVGDSIDIHPGLENEQVTIKIDTPPYYRNLTYEEKILIQRPLFGLGKSAEQVGDSIDIHPGLENEQVTIKIDTPPYYRNLTHEEKILIQRPLFGLGKSAENSRISTKHGKRSYEHTTNLPERNAMKIDEESHVESHVNQDWREHLRKAVKERLRKLTESEEKSST
ncbi:uncharacterized protein LOC123688849 [Harmonia axyridis]|uniref:uncharacterized protein LOC123688849 n=1 Tax=Harmonia axyridis TaxID=115357 RepID=UPI001E276C2D|nr:uncharacterized protein LOC123688849 [Harmonia axyridis]